MLGFKSNTIITTNECNIFVFILDYNQFVHYAQQTKVNHHRQDKKWRFSK